MGKSFLAVIALVALLPAAAVQADVNSLRSALMGELEGTINCNTKCQDLFAQGTNEHTVCQMGCEKCATVQSGTNQCQEYCKKNNWSKQGLCKDTVEPDKSCMFGCIIGLCQGTICTGSSCWNKGGCASPTAGQCNGC